MPDLTLTALRTAKAVIHQRYTEARASGASEQQLRDLELAENHFRTRINQVLLAEANASAKAQ